MAKGYKLVNDDGSVANVVNILSTTSSINLKNTGQTTLYTVPAGKSAIVTDVIIEITASSVFALAATARVGKASAYTEFIAATALTGLSAVGNYVSLASASLLPIRSNFSATDVIKLDITVGATATTLTGRVHVIGFLI